MAPIPVDHCDSASPPPIPSSPQSPQRKLLLTFTIGLAAFNGVLVAATALVWIVSSQMGSNSPDNGGTTANETSAETTRFSGRLAEAAYQPTSSTAPEAQSSATQIASDPFDVSQTSDLVAQESTVTEATEEVASTDVIHLPAEPTPTIEESEIVEVAVDHRIDIPDPLPYSDAATLVTDLESSSNELKLFRSTVEARRVIERYQVGTGRQRPRGPVDFNVVDRANDRSDLQGLPFVMGDDCHLETDETLAMAHISPGLARIRTSFDRQRQQFEQNPEMFEAAIERARQAGVGGEMLAQLQANNRRMAQSITDEARDTQLTNYVKQMMQRLDDPSSAVPTLVQMLQVESLTLRRFLVQTLGEIDSPTSSQALAELATFDIDPAVRDAAVSELMDRDSTEYVSTLVDNLRYPWAPAAYHSAEALAQLGPGMEDLERIESRIEEMLEMPDPTLPYQNQEGEWIQTELVRVNHLSNCMLCHETNTGQPQSGSRNNNQVTGLIPVPNEQIPVQYYQSRSGSFVDATTTYLRQDFSLMHQVEDSGPWPEMQRFDYLLRHRPMSPPEVHAWQEQLNCESHQPSQQQPNQSPGDVQRPSVEPTNESRPNTDDPASPGDRSRTREPNGDESNEEANEDSFPQRDAAQFVLDSWVAAKSRQ